MPRLRSVGAVMTAVAALLPTAAQPAAKRSETIEQASRAFDDAQFRKDVRAIGLRLSPDLVYINGAGRVGSVREFVAAFSDPRVTFDPFIIRDRQVVMLSRDIAVVTGDGTIAGTDGGARFHDRFRYSDTFVRRSGTWRVAYVQVTKLPDQ